MLDLNGGTLRNAIPREGHVTLAVAADKVEQLKKLSQNYLATLKDELIAVEKSDPSTRTRLYRDESTD